MNETIIDRDRAEGVYCQWETYPPEGFGIMRDNILVIERVCGDWTVKRFECARSEAMAIKDFLKGFKG